MDKNEKYNNILKSVLLVVLTACIVYTITSIYYFDKINASTTYNIQSRYLDGIKYNKPLDKMEKILGIIEDKFLFEYDHEKVLEGAIRGALEALEDPYTSYFNKKEMEQFLIETEGEYDGVGLYITYNTEKEMVQVITPIEGTPAADAGLLPGDFIETVDGELTAKAELDSVSNKLKGTPGTTVKVDVIRYDKDGNEIKFSKTLERKKINLDPVIENVLEDNIGYIKLTTFDETTYREFKNVYDDLIKNKKVKGLILDVRNNPGGLMSIATKIADLLVPSGKIVYTVNKNNEEDVTYSDDVKINIPLVVIINEGSASATEILAGAIKDHGVGVIVGTKSYGKGIVQELKLLLDGTCIKVTSSEYFSPNGTKINGVGIKPDIEVQLPEDVKSVYKLPLEKDTQLQEAIKEIKKKI